MEHEFIETMLNGFTLMVNDVDCGTVMINRLEGKTTLWYPPVELNAEFRLEMVQNREAAPILIDYISVFASEHGDTRIMIERSSHGIGCYFDDGTWKDFGFVPLKDDPKLLIKEL